MQKLVKTAGELPVARRALRKLASRVQTTDIARLTGVHQSQVSRVLRGQFKRLSPNVQAILALSRNPASSVQGAGNSGAGKSSVVRAALRAWDSTPEGAQALVRLLRSVEGLRRLRRTSRSHEPRSTPPRLHSDRRPDFDAMTHGRSRAGRRTA